MLHTRSGASRYIEIIPHSYFQTVIVASKSTRVIFYDRMMRYDITCESLFHGIIVQYNNSPGIVYENDLSVVQIHIAPEDKTYI